MAGGANQKDLLRLGFETVLGVGPDKAAGVYQDELTRWMPIIKIVRAKPK